MRCHNGFGQWQRFGYNLNKRVSISRPWFASLDHCVQAQRKVREGRDGLNSGHSRAGTVRRQFVLRVEVLRLVAEAGAWETHIGFAVPNLERDGSLNRGGCYSLGGWDREMEAVGRLR